MKQLLLVEDDSNAARYFSQLLVESGYSVECLSDGTKAVETARRLKPDLILLDLVLPGCDGVAIARELSSHEDTRDIPIVVITALSPLETPEARLREIPSFRRCIFKPCRARTFLAAVRDVLDAA